MTRKNYWLTRFTFWLNLLCFLSTLVLIAIWLREEFLLLVDGALINLFLAHDGRLRSGRDHIVRWFLVAHLKIFCLLWLFEISLGSHHPSLVGLLASTATDYGDLVSWSWNLRIRLFMEVALARGVSLSNLRLNIFDIIGIVIILNLRVSLILSKSRWWLILWSKVVTLLVTTSAFATSWISIVRINKCTNFLLLFTYPGGRQNRRKQSFKRIHLYLVNLYQYISFSKN